VFFVLAGTAAASYVVSSNAQIGPGTVSGHKPPSGDHANVISGSVNGTDLAAGAVTPTKLAKSAPYSVVGAAGQPPFENGWDNFGFGDSTAAFYKDPLGMVHLRGSISGPTASFAFTLPADYRPAKTLVMPAAGGGPEAVVLNIDALGRVTPYCTGSSCVVGIGGLSFRAGS
jgi:hypothetical protein